jgi:hypothetical protein|tara:strand:+ start:506 stop:841 length:336 start_codon:yes stop_codon:yes gene_type:complete
MTMIKTQAIQSLYSDAAFITVDGENIVVMDINGKSVSVNKDDVAAKEAELKTANELEELRRVRNKLLSETDHWVLPDTADVTSAQTKYRQDLRDITKSATSLDDVTWPEKP